MTESMAKYGYGWLWLTNRGKRGRKRKETGKMVGTQAAIYEVISGVGEQTRTCTCTYVSFLFISIQKSTNSFFSFILSSVFANSSSSCFISIIIFTKKRSTEYRRVWGGKEDMYMYMYYMYMPHIDVGEYIKSRQSKRRRKSIFCGQIVWFGYNICGVGRF